MIRRAALLTLALVALSSQAQAEGGGPVYKDLERFGPSGPPRGEAAPLHAEPGAFRPARRTDLSPGYVGSDYGLGKPAFTGLGSRPDWGRSSD